MSADNGKNELVHICPICKALGVTKKVTLFAIWDSNKAGQPDDQKFWGKPGNRTIIHQQGAWVHFRVGNDDGRLAYLKGCADGGAWRRKNNT